MDVDKVGGVKVKDKEGNEINYAGMVNCLKVPIHAPMTGMLPEGVIDHFYNHMDFKGSEDTVLVDDISKEGLEKLKDKYSQEKNFQRINGTGLKYDLLQVHGQIGIANWADGKKADPRPYLASAAALALDVGKNGGYVVEGHMHKSYDGKNSFHGPVFISRSLVDDSGGSEGAKSSDESGNDTGGSGGGCFVDTTK